MQREIRPDEKAWWVFPLIATRSCCHRDSYMVRLWGTAQEIEEKVSHDPELLVLDTMNGCRFGPCELLILGTDGEELTVSDSFSEKLTDIGRDAARRKE